MQRNRKLTVAAWVVVVVVGALICYLLRHQPFYWDAKGYVESSIGIRSGGLLSAWPFAAVRTYAYPLALNIPLIAADVLHISPVAAIFVFQWTLFVGSAWLVANTLFDAPRTRLFAFIAIAANPLLVVYTPQALTEALTLTCILFGTAALGRAYRAHSPVSKAAWLTAGALAAGFALAVRPGSIFVPVCYGVGAVFVLFLSRRRLSRLALATSAVLTLVGVGVPLAPQVMVNWHNFELVSVLPETDIAEIQLDYGLHLLRYATNVSTCGPAPMYFTNPLAGQTGSEISKTEIIKFYALKWPNGPETAAIHVFSALDPRPFLTYQTAYGAWYERALQAFTLAIIGLAGLAIAKAPRSIRRIRPDVVFLGAAALCSLAVLTVSAVELRFGSILVTSLSVLAASGAARLKKPRVAVGIAVAIAFAFALLTWFAFSDLILATSPNWFPCG
jgi:hypothetical protein